MTQLASEQAMHGLDGRGNAGGKTSNMMITHMGAFDAHHTHVMGAGMLITHIEIQPHRQVHSKQASAARLPHCTATRWANAVTNAVVLPPAAAVFTLTLLALVLADASATLSQTPSTGRLLYAIVVSSVALFGHATGQCWPAGNGRQRVRCAGVTAGMAIWLGARNVK